LVRDPAGYGHSVRVKYIYGAFLLFKFLYKAHILFITWVCNSKRKWGIELEES
jgi:hypothetical protein